MREIKFKVYNKTGRKINFDKIEIIPKKQTNIIDFTIKDNSENIILCQYTGLKDCKGREIYEGDIIKAKTVMIDMPIWIGEVMRECDYIGINKNESAEWVIVDRKLGSYIGFYPGQKQDREIIGNIFENKDLLK